MGTAIIAGKYGALKILSGGRASLEGVEPNGDVGYLRIFYELIQFSLVAFSFRMSLSSSYEDDQHGRIDIWESYLQDQWPKPSARWKCLKYQEPGTI